MPSRGRSDRARAGPRHTHRRSRRSACRRRPAARRSRARACARRAPRSRRRPHRAADQPLDLDVRPLLAARRLSLHAIARRCRQQRVLGRHPAAARAQPARHLFLYGRGAENLRLALRPEHRAVRLLQPVELDPSGRSSSARRPSARVTPRPPRVRERDVLHLADRQLEEAAALRAERAGVAGRQESVAAFACRVVLESLAGERHGDFTCGFLRGEDERDVAAEHAVEDGSDQRVVRAPEDHGVDAGLLQRRRILAHRLLELLERRVVLDQRHEARAGDLHRARCRRRARARARRSARRRRSPAWRADRRGGSASRAPPQPPQVRSRRSPGR